MVGKKASTVKKEVRICRSMPELMGVDFERLYGKPQETKKKSSKKNKEKLDDQVPSPPVVARSTFLKYTAWDNGTTIKIAFMGGTPEQREHVRSVASKWLSYVNLQFQWYVVQEESDVRIAFVKGEGSWSYLGKQNTYVDKAKATMNYGWLSDVPATDERGTILHEFGHMLGLAHEHQNPNSVLTWKRDVVIASLSGPPNNWSVETIEANVFNKYSTEDNVVATAQDMESIMMYSFPGVWNEENIPTHSNNSLSRTDKLAISQMYPKGDDWTIDYESDDDENVGPTDPPKKRSCCAPIVENAINAIAQRFQKRQ